MFRQSGSPSVDLLMTRAEAALAAADNKTAKKLVEAVTNIAPNYAEGWHARAAMEQAAGNDTAAMVSLQKVVLLNPRQFAAMVELADMLEDYGDKAGALKLYRRALALDPQLDVRRPQGARADPAAWKAGNLSMRSGRRADRACGHACPVLSAAPAAANLMVGTWFGTGQPDDKDAMYIDRMPRRRQLARRVPHLHQGQGAGPDADRPLVAGRATC